MRLAGFLGRALARTASLWPDVLRGARWMERAAAILDNADEVDASTVRLRYARWLQRLRQAVRAGTLSAGLCDAVQHFVKVTRSYGKGLFHCYRIEGLPRTNNDLEQVFGSARYHERRASGRKVASPAIVQYGAVRLPAAVFTRTGCVTVSMLAGVSHDRWRRQRIELAQRRQSRCQRLRFRKDPQAYLARLEQEVRKRNLPS